MATVGVREASEVMNNFLKVMRAPVLAAFFVFANAVVLGTVRPFQVRAVPFVRRHFLTVDRAIHFNIIGRRMRPSPRKYVAQRLKVTMARTLLGVVTMSGGHWLVRKTGSFERRR